MSAPLPQSVDREIIGSRAMPFGRNGSTAGAARRVLPRRRPASGGVEHDRATDPRTTDPLEATRRAGTTIDAVRRTRSG